MVGSEFVTKKFDTLEMDILLNIHHTLGLSFQTLTICVSLEEVCSVSFSALN